MTFTNKTLKTVSNELVGKNFVYAGLDFVQAKYVINTVFAQGGFIKTSISDKIDYLVGDNPNTEKYGQAMRLISNGHPIQIISYDTFIEMINRCGVIEHDTAGFMLSGKTITKYLGSDNHVIIPEGVERIGPRAFDGCAFIETVSFPGSLTTIMNSAFTNCTSLISLVIPGNVTTISSAAFLGCRNLERICLQEGVIKIGWSAFALCDKLKEITIPTSVNEIGSAVFDRCTSLKTAHFLGAVMQMGGDVFRGCSCLTDVTFSEGPVSMGAAMLLGCDALVNISFPDTIESLSWNNLRDLKNMAYSEYESGLYLGNAGSQFLIFAMPTNKDINSIVIHPDAKIIASEAFAECHNLTSITIPHNIIEICPKAFANCENLAEVAFESDIARIDSFAFVGCPSLQDDNGLCIVKNIVFAYFGSQDRVTIPQGTIKIDDFAFAGANLVSITIPESVKEIGECAFDDCDDLIIYGAKGSYAEQYAQKKGICFYSKETKCSNQALNGYHIPSSQINTGVSMNQMTSNVTTVRKDSLLGKTFVVTGDLHNYQSRGVLKQIIEERGGKLTGSISVKTTALVTNYPDSGTTKIKKALELGIEIIAEEEFIHRYLTD